MDTISICDLELWASVGVSDAERGQSQRLLVTIEMVCPFASAAATDDLSETIDYHAVARRLLVFGSGRQWKLIERLASEIAEMILAEFGPESVAVEVRKFVLPQTRYVSVRTLKRKGASGPESG